MSLVELAIKKMQAASGKEAPASTSLEDTAKLKALYVPDALAGSDEAGAASDMMSAALLEPRLAGTVHEAGPPTAALATAPPPRAARSGHRPDGRVIKLDRQLLRSQGLLPPEHQERALADQYRQVKRPLIANAIGRGGAEKLPRGQLIMVASAMPGEGKTFTSMNLAMSLALEKDLSVLLIDADAPKPHLDHALGIAGEPGLLDLLRDESLDPEALIIPTDVPALSVLPVGTGSETTTELLASHRMEEIMRQLAANDPLRIVIIDSSPLLLTSESRVLAEAAGQVVLVVRAGYTSQQAVLDAISHLGEGKSIGLLLNQSKDVAPSGYYYGYGESKP